MASITITNNNTKLSKLILQHYTPFVKLAKLVNPVQAI